MTAALATLLFLTTLWLLAVIGSAIFEQSGGKIVAALKGRSREPVLQTAPMRLRHRERDRAAYQSMPRMRAAA